MSGPVELAFSQSSSSARLPAIGNNTNLVSQPIARPSNSLNEGEKPEIPKEIPETQDEALNREKRKLKKLISRAFITALHQSNDVKCWHHLREVIELAEPYLSILKTKELCHYAERSYLELQGQDNLQDVCEVLQRAFVDVQSVDKKKSKFPSVLDEDVLLTSRKKHAISKGVRIPRGEVKSSMPPMCLPANEQIFDHEGKLSHYPKAIKELSLIDLRISLTEVVKEISTRESVLGVPLGMTILALDVNLPPTHTPSPPPKLKPPSVPVTSQKNVGKDSELERKKLVAKKETVFVPRTAMEIVEDFIKGSFLGELKFAYVNFAPSERYNPYNLIEVPKDRVDPEHFIISTHSILHVAPNCPSESQLITDWYIEASTFQAVMNLSLFKNFILKKAFMKLKNAKKFTFFKKTKNDIEQSLIQNVQTFGSALLRISSLLSDLSKVTFLPFETKSCYSLSDFEEQSFKTSDTGRTYVNKFFAFCQMIVNKTQSNCFEYLKYCEAQIKSHRHNYKESLSVSKEKKQVRQRNLRLAHEEVAKLGNFVNLVDHIIIQNLITVAQTNICRFVDVTLPGPRPDREALFKADIVFNDNHRLVLSPSTKQLTYSISSSLEIVLSIVCNLSRAMELDEDTKAFIDRARKTRSAPTAKTPKPAEHVKPESTVRFSSRIDALSDTDQIDIYSYSNLKSDEDTDDTMQNIRSEDEIINDIQDFNTGIDSARVVKETYQGLCTKRPQENILVVHGQKVEQLSVSSSPLTREKLHQTLYNNEKIRDAIKYQEEFVSEAVEEVNGFCDNHTWLCEIHQFVSRWDDAQMEYWKAQPTAVIEQQLKQIQTWTEQVGNVIKTFSTANGLLYINCIPIQEIIIPKLRGIFNEMVTMVASQVMLLSDEAVYKMESLAETIKEQRTEIKLFAMYINQLEAVKNEVPDLKEKVEYIKNLFEVIRGCFRQLTAEEEITEEKVWACWESFLFGLQEASDFIHIQKPVVTERLNETITSLEEQVFGIGHRAMSGQYVDPDEVPSKVLSDLRVLRDRGRKICYELKIISVWREGITGSTYDTTEVMNVLETIEKRLELWRYYEVSSNRITDWNNSEFVKLPHKRIIDTVKEWEIAANNFKTYIDEDDNILVAFISKLQEFSKELPLLLQLSSDSLKQRHWRSLFISMGQEFDQSMKFTLKGLLEMNIGRHKELIEVVCSGADHENDLHANLKQLIKSWVDRDFKLAKHVPFIRSRIEEENTNRRTSAKQKDRKRKMTAHESKAKPRTPTGLPDAYILIGIPELKCMIEDNLVTLQSMLASPYVIDIKPLVQQWIDHLTELEDILNIWETCQMKWLYLTNVFSEPQMAIKYAEHLESFKEIDKQYQLGLIDVISKNSKITSVLSKKRGDLGWRELQGENLRIMLLELIRQQEDLTSFVREYFEIARADFPRLFLLSDRTLLDLLAWSRNPKDLIPFVKMCFPGIKNLQFKLPKDISVKLTSTLDAALNAHLLEVTGLQGNYGEQMDLISPIPASAVPQRWLTTLEQAMRDSLMNELAHCVRTRLDHGAINFTRLVEQFIQTGKLTDQDSANEEAKCLLDFPAQCIDKTEAVLWARKVSHALVTARLQDLSNIKSEIKSSIEDLASAIRKSIESPSETPEQKRLDVIAANLLTQAVSHRDIVDGLIDDRVTTVHSFEWQSQLRSKMDITEEISTSYDGKRDSTISEIPLERSYNIGICSLEQLGCDIPYGYEFYGPTTGLVVTPLARRCFLTLTMALKAFKCGILHGPNGTGKTETTHHLSKMLGRHVVTLNCTSSLTSSTLVSYLSAMLRSGSWVCLENIDTMHSGVLSVFGQHLEKIRLALKSIQRDLHSQYTVRGNTEHNLGRRPTMASLTPLHGEESVWIKDQIQEEISTRRRRLSATEADNFLDTSSTSNVCRVEPLSSLQSSSHCLEKTYQDTQGSYRYRSLSPLTFTMPLLGHIVFNGNLIAVSEMFGCFMTMSSYKHSYTKIPENLKTLLRPVAMVVPDIQAIIEVNMSCCGFTESTLLAKKLHTFFRMISDQMSSENDLSLRSMRTVVRFASYQLRKELKKKSVNESTSSQDDEAPTRSPFMESFERRQTEENALVHALFSFFGNKLMTSDKEVFSRTVDAVFIHSVIMSVISEGEPELCDEIKEYFVSHGFQVKPELLAKTVQLYKSIKSSGNVIVIGSSGSGKSTLYQALTGAINSLHTHLLSDGSKQRKKSLKTATDKAWPMLDVTVVFPKSLTNEELFGYRDSSTNAWRDGLISKFFRDSTLTSRTKDDVLKMSSEEKQRTIRGLREMALVEKWLVLDGPMDDLWLGGMSTVLDSSKTLSLGKGGSIAVPDTVSILFETTDLSNASPSLITCCSIVHCPSDLLGWKAIFRPWIKSAHSKWDISNRGLGLISCLMDHVVDKTLDFLENHCKTVLTADFGCAVSRPSPARGIYEVQSLLRYLSAIFDQHILREDDPNSQGIEQQPKGGTPSVAGSSHSRHSSGIIAGDTDKVIATFAFAFVWAFGGHLQDRYAKTFDEHARQVLSSGPYPACIPEDGLVYDYHMDFTKGALIKWEERPGAQFKTFASSYTVVPEFDRYFFLMDLMITAGQPVVLVGEPGTGKSALVQNLVSPRHSYHRIFMSSALTSKLFQDAIESKLHLVERRDMLDLSPLVSKLKHKPLLYFLDDLNYADIDKNNTQPPLELLRQILTQGCLYDKDRQQYYPVKNAVQFIGTAVPPSATGVGGGVASHVISPCLSRLMTVLSFFPASSQTLTVIYSGIFLGWLKGFPAYSMTHHAEIAKAMAEATVHLFNKVREELRPSPLYPHFIFNQHDLARIAASFTLFSSSSRGRKRPRVRKKGGGAGRKNVRVKTTKEEEISALGYDGEATISTPALLSPIIRSLFRLWCHENTRTYSDRLINDDQRYWFSSVLQDLVMEHFCHGVEDIQPEKVNQPLFPAMSRESIGVAPGTSAPPPSAKLSRSSGVVGKLIDDEGSELQGSQLIEDIEDLEVKVNEQEQDLKLETVVKEISGKDNDNIQEDKKDASSVQTSSVDIKEDEPNKEATECTFTAQTPNNEPSLGVSNDNKDIKGPLITLKQLSSPGEDLSDIMFCKQFHASSNLSTAITKSNTHKGYVECTIDALEKGMAKSLKAYNLQTTQDSSFKKINLVTFREALCHASRISRALSLEGGHALLLSHHGYGRRTLTRLAAYAARYSLIEVQNTPFQGQGELRQQIKEASYIAGLQGKPVVLFVPEDQTDQSLQDICTVMVEGTFPGLYTKNELVMITSNLLSVGERGVRRAGNVEIAQERFFRRVKSQLHVVVCLKYSPYVTSSSPSQSQVYRFPILLTRCCCVDTFLPWPHEALANIAEKLIDANDLSPVPWKRKVHTSAVCSIMAHVHLTSRSMVHKLYGIKGLKFYSPDTYLDFVMLFRNFSARICLKEKEKVSRLKHGITRMQEAHDTIDGMNNELAELDPLYKQAQESVKQYHDDVEASQAEYHDQKEACKKKEIEIQALQEPVEMLKQETSEQFGKISPLFCAAYTAIHALDIRDVEELRSYRVPPLLVELVVNCVCLLFNKEQTWLEGKLLLNRDNFFKDLEFYNMRGMSDTMFYKLEGFYKNPSFKPKIVKAGSKAAASICMWARAVYEYCIVFRALQPKRMQLMKAEQLLKEAKATLGEMRVRYNEIKKELENRIQTYKECMKHLKTTEKKIQGINVRKSHAESLVNSMKESYDCWQTLLSESQQNLVTVAGDSLLAAASVCYLGALDHNVRQELFNDWLRVCDGKSRVSNIKRSSLASRMIVNPTTPSTKEMSSSKPHNSIAFSNTVPVRDSPSLAGVLAERDDLVEWVNKGLPNDEHSVQNALIMRLCNDRTYCWPLLIDPHRQAEMWVRAIVELHLDSPTDKSGRPKSSGSSRPSSSLDYRELEPADEDISITGDMCNEDLSGGDDQSVVLDGRDTSLTQATDHSTDISDKTFKESIVKEMGIQSPNLPSISTATPNLDVREGQVMVISADDSQLVSKVRAAVIGGVVVLITHMERRRLSKKLELLLSRQTFIDKNNEVKIVIGKSTVSYHPSFRLFLSSSMPLYMKGEALVPLPLSKTCVVDMTLSQEGLTNRLLLETLTLERPEYEGQKRSLERDLTLHQQQILTAQTFILDKVLDLMTPLLSDPNISNVVEKCKGVILIARSRHEEAQAMEKQLQEKRGDFLPVASYGSLLYMIICQMQKVQPYCYFTSLDVYLKLFKDTILHRKRNKKSLGSSAARAAELISALSRAIYTRISWGLFLSDNLLFPFLISVEKLLNEGGITEEELKLFIYQPPVPEFLETVEKQRNKPAWISHDSWRVIDQLELLPSLTSLRKSLNDYSDEWREYFLLPPVLLANTPGDLPQLTVFQKALLWKVFRPEQVHQICQDLVLYTLGATMVHPKEYDIQQVYSVCNNATPIVFLLPSYESVSNGSSISIRDPYDDILHLAQSHEKSSSLITVSLGETNAMDEALRAVRYGMEIGYWVVIHNADLADDWSREFIDTLQVITCTYQAMDVNEDDEVYSVWTDDPELRTPMSRNLSIVHPDFRLFITTRVGSGRPLPAVLIQRGLKLACESKTTYLSTMGQVFEASARSVNSWTSYWNTPFTNDIKSTVPRYALYAMAYLHSAFHHRRQYGSLAFTCPYEWTYNDVHGGSDVLRHLSNVLHDGSRPVQLDKLLDMLACTVYSGHVFDKMDLLALRSLAHSLSTSQHLQATIESQDPSDDTLKAFPESLTFEELGLIQNSGAYYRHRRSRSLMTAVRTIMDIKPQQFCLDKVVQNVNQLKTVINKVSCGIIVPEQSKTTTAVTCFFLKELMFYKRFLDGISHDLELLSKAIVGYIAFTPLLHSLLVDIYHCTVPKQWLDKCGGPQDLSEWLETFSSHVTTVQEYNVCSPLVVSIGLLTHQQAFLSCVMVDCVKTTSKSPHSLAFNMQIMPMTFKPKNSPDSGIYVSGLSVCNASWDIERRCLTSCAVHVTELPIVLLTLQTDNKHKSISDLIVYDCPLIHNDHPLTTLPLLSALSLEELQKRKVSLVT